MRDVFICDSVRTAVGRYGGGLAMVRTDDLAAIPLRALVSRNPSIDLMAIDDVVLGCANQAGEDNRNVARMALLLAGLPVGVPGVTVNRLCASGLDAIAIAVRAIRSGEADLMIAGGVESMSRAPFVMGKATTAFSRTAEVFDTTIGWRFINEAMRRQYGVDLMPETAENLATELKISREDQDRFAVWSQTKAAAAQSDGRLAEEIIPVTIPQRKGDPIVFVKDENLRLSSLEQLAKLEASFCAGGTVTAGNASGINDGAAAIIVASDEAAKRFGLARRARIVGTAAAGVAPRTMGLGPVPATNKLLKRIGLSLDDLDLIELNEAFAVQSLACTRQLGLADYDPRINPLGGAIALGHPLGMSGARLVVTAVHQLQRTKKSRALCTMCVGVGQGLSMVLERC